jgi:hypothetical protein
MGNFETVGNYVDRFSAEMFQSILAESGIPSQVRADDAGGLDPQLLVGAGGATLLVRTEDVSRALELLQYEPLDENFNEDELSQEETDPENSEQSSSVVGCNLNVFSEAEQKRHLAILTVLRAANPMVIELQNGLAFHYKFDSSLFFDVAEFITLESKCCSFNIFNLEYPVDKGLFQLSVTGPVGSAEFIRAALVP